jgi:tRNA threonylcarbamoyladenosine biosynthesis protein TsaB
MMMVALESSTEMGSVAVMDGGRLVGEITYWAHKSHSEKLLPALDQLLKGAGLAPGDLEGLAVGIGPGSFTGTRIALSTAKGLALALGIPLVGISSLEALAGALRYWRGDICAIVNPKKERAITARLRFNSKGEIEYLEGPAIRVAPEWIKTVEGEALFTGNGVDLFIEEMGRGEAAGWHTAPPEMRFPRASFIARMAMERINEVGDEVDILTPIYVEESPPWREKQ